MDADFDKLSSGPQGASEVRIGPDEGWAGIAAALGEAAGPTIIQLGPGEYVGEQTLNIPSGVTLAGSDNVQLKYKGCDAAILIDGVKNVCLRRLNVDGWENLDGETVDEPSLKNGLLTVKNASRITIEGCRVIARAKLCSGLLVERSIGVLISQCNVNGALSAISYVSSRGTIAHTSCTGATESGILLASGGATPAEGSEAVIENNRCHGNGGAGILLRSSISSSLSGNECWDNEWSGVLLARDPESPSEGSEAVIENNRCHGNKISGISLQSSSSSSLSGNECWDNGSMGICLQRDPESPSEGSEAVIENNRCHGNKFFGISLQSSISSSLSGNECWDNESVGVSLQRDPKSPSEGSEAVIENNRCHGNKISGISLQSSISSSLSGNECWGNKSAGVLLARDPRSPSEGSEAVIENNRCHGSTISGISLQSSSSSSLSGNECWGNGSMGVLLARDPRSPSEVSEAVIENNRCHGNGIFGILLQSSISSSLSGNECWDNEWSGVLLTRDSESPSKGSEAIIENNRCHGNKFFGISLQSSSSSSLSGNECWDNGSMGICLQRDPESPDEESEAVIENNRCHSNSECGILLASSTSRSVSGNLCWDNGNYGIALIRDKKSSWAASSVELLQGNILARNGRASIVIVGSVARVVDSHAFDNGNDYIMFTQDEAFPVPEPVIGQETIGAPVPMGRRSDDGLNSRLAAHTGKDAPALSGFLSSGGCASCFGEFWGNKPDLALAPVGDGTASQSDTHPLLHLEAHARSGTEYAPSFSLKSNGDAPLEDILQRLFGVRANKAGRFRNNRTSIVGVAGPNPDVVLSFAQDIGRLPDILRNYVAADDEMVGPLYDIARQIAEREVQVGTPLVIDYQYRNKSELSPPRDPLLAQELMRGRSRWRDTPRELLQKPAIWILAAVVTGVSVAPPLAEGRTLMMSVLFGGSLEFSLRSLAPLLFLLPAGLYLLVFGLNLLLPPPLEIPIRGIRRIQRIFGDAGFAGSFEAAETVRRSKIVSGLKARAWRSWLKRRVFGNFDLAVICLTDVEDWHERDLEVLTQLAEMKEEAQSLLVVIHTHGRHTVPGAIFPLWRAGCALDLLIDDDPARVDLASLIDPANDDREFAALLGWTDLAGQPVSRFAEFKGGLRHSSWCAYDLAPLAILASAPAHRYQVRLGVRAFSQARDEFAEDIQSCRAIFGSDAADAGQIDETEVERVFGFAKQALGLRFSHRKSDEKDYQIFEGRLGRRKAMAGCLLSLWDDQEEACSYLLKAVACGEVALVDQIISMLDEPRGTNRLIGVRSRVRSLAFLARDRRRLRETMMRDKAQRFATLDDAWANLRHTLNEQIIDCDLEDLAGLYMDYLAAREVKDDADTFECALAELRADIEAWLPSNEQASQGSCRSAFVAQTGRLIHTFAALDSALVTEFLESLFRQDWYTAPERLRTWLRHAALGGGAKRLSVAEMLAAAEGADAIQLVVRLHAGHAARVVHLMGLAASRYLRHCGDINGDEAIAGLAQIGLNLTKIRDACAKRHPISGEYKELLGKDQQPFLVTPDNGKVVAKFLMDENNVNLLIKNLNSFEQPSDIVVEGIESLSSPVLRREIGPLTTLVGVLG